MLTAESSGSLHGGEGPGAGGAHGFLQALRRRGWAVVVCVVLACGTALGLSLTTTPTYTATAALYFSLEHGITANDLAQGATYTKDQMSSYATLATTPAVLRPVIDRLQLHTTPAALAGQVTASAAADTVVLDVAARSTSATQAADIANAVADQLTSSVEAVAPTDVNGHATVRVTPVTPATPPAAPSSPRTTLDLVAGLIAGLALGLLYVFLREALDTRVRDARRVQELTDAPVLGRIPAVGRDGGHVVVATAPRSLQSELFRQLRTNLEFLRAPGEPLTLVVTSSLPGEGKSTVAVNLALSLAEVSDRVLLIDADLRRPSVADRLDLEGAAGLSTVLVGRAEFDDVVQHWGEHGLDVLTSGALPPNPAQLLDSPRMVALLDMLGARYDVILIDTAPVLPVTDALLLSRCTQGTLVVADSRRVRRHQLAGALRQLATVQAPLLGVVLNRLAGGKQVYGYGTYDSPSPAGTDQSEPQRWSVPWPARGGRPSLPSPTSVEEPAPHTPGEPATTAARP
jgi:capsular exopolysaccharide synthesis family protein